LPLGNITNKRFSERGLFDEMCIARGLSLTSPKILGDNRYLLEFDSMVVRDHIMVGGPCHHKCDALIMVAVDDFTWPSEVAMESINMWLQFYDLPKAMIESFARKLGESLGHVLTVDNSFPTYLRARIVFPLAKPLVPEIKMKVKGRGDMSVIIRYENVPHFCFGCRRLGHADREYPDVKIGEVILRFSVELRASPPKHTKQVMLCGQFQQLQGA
jgi:hypothetical protein